LRTLEGLSEAEDVAASFVAHLRIVAEAPLFASATIEPIKGVASPVRTASIRSEE